MRWKFDWLCTTDSCQSIDYCHFPLGITLSAHRSAPFWNAMINHLRRQLVHILLFEHFTYIDAMFCDLSLLGKITAVFDSHKWRSSWSKRSESGITSLVRANPSTGYRLRNRPLLYIDYHRTECWAFSPSGILTVAAEDHIWTLSLAFESVSYSWILFNFLPVGIVTRWRIITRYK